MSISSITDELWPDILRIQREVYSAIEPESLEVMRSKWLHSPEFCFVYRDAEHGVAAYLLAHAWHSRQPPKLHCPLPPDSGGDVLFVHDLSISQKLAGRGVGRKLVQRVLKQASDCEKRQALLVSIQASEGFWSKMGFMASPQAADAAYGDRACVMGMELPHATS